MLKFLGGGGAIKVEKAEAEVTVQEHSLKWWLDRGVKCPDCGDITYLFIQSQSRMGISRCASELWDTQHTAEFVCGINNMGFDLDAEVGCGCKFQAEAIEKETWQREPLYKRVK